jgi:prephenate dehydratase
VIFTLDLFADLAGRYPDILVSGEIYLPVHHCLLGHAAPCATTSTSTTTPTSQDQHPSNSDLPLRNKLQPSGGSSPDRSGTVTPTQAAPEPQKPRVKPIHDIKHIKKLYSHPQAWGQCKLFLSTYLKQAERQDVSSTSKAAEHVAQESSGTSAAISSKIAAEMNGLDVLAEGIEDVEGNSTRFFVLRRAEDVLAAEGEEVDEEAEMGRFKSLVSFTLNHGEPGSLADCLEVFRKGRLNLTSINTRPSGEAPWLYIFFVEFMGKKRADGKGGAVNDALEKLTSVASTWRWLGSWESALED